MSHVDNGSATSRNDSLNTPTTNRKGLTDHMHDPHVYVILSNHTLLCHTIIYHTVIYPAILYRNVEPCVDVVFWAP